MTTNNQAVQTQSEWAPAGAPPIKELLAAFIATRKAAGDCPLWFPYGRIIHDPVVGDLAGDGFPARVIRNCMEGLEFYEVQLQGHLLEIQGGRNGHAGLRWCWYRINAVTGVGDLDHASNSDYNSRHDDLRLAFRKWRRLQPDFAGKRRRVTGYRAAKQMRAAKERAERDAERERIKLLARQPAIAGED